MPLSMIPPVYRRLSDGAYPVPAWHRPDPADHVEVLMDDPPAVPAGWVAELAEQPDADNILRYSLRELTEEERAPAVPESVERVQALLTLQDAQDGLIPALNDAQGAPLFPTLAADVLAWRNDPARTLAEIGLFDHGIWRRDSDLMAAIGAGFGLSDAQIDTLFRAARAR